MEKKKIRDLGEIRFILGIKGALNPTPCGILFIESEGIFHIFNLFVC